MGAPMIIARAAGAAAKGAAAEGAKGAVKRGAAQAAKERLTGKAQEALDGAGGGAGAGSGAGTGADGSGAQETGASGGGIKKGENGLYDSSTELGQDALASKPGVGAAIRTAAKDAVSKGAKKAANAGLSAAEKLGPAPVKAAAKLGKAALKARDDKKKGALKDNLNGDGEVGDLKGELAEGNGDGATADGGENGSGKGGDGKSSGGGSGSSKKKPFSPGNALKMAIPAMILQSLPFVIPLLIIGFIVMSIGGCAAGLFGLGSSATSDESLIEQEQGVFIPSVKVEEPKGFCDDDETASSSGSDGGDDSGGSYTDRGDCIQRNDSSSTPLGDWIYYDQTNPTWTGHESGSSWGQSCGQVALAMILSSYANDEKYNPSYVREKNLGTSGGALASGETIAKYVNDNSDTFGLKGKAMDWTPNSKESWKKIKEACDNGGCYLIYQRWSKPNKKSSFVFDDGTVGAHWVVIRKVSGDKVTVANPNGGCEEVFSKSKIISEGSPNKAGGIPQGTLFTKN